MMYAKAIAGTMLVLLAVSVVALPDVCATGADPAGCASPGEQAGSDGHLPMRRDNKGRRDREDDHSGDIGGCRQAGGCTEIRLTVDWIEGRVLCPHCRRNGVSRFRSAEGSQDTCGNPDAVRSYPPRSRVPGRWLVPDCRNKRSWPILMLAKTVNRIPTRRE